MKKTMIAASLLFAGLLFFQSSQAQGYNTALGIRLSSGSAMVGNSISVKHFINDKTAIEGLFSFGDPLALGVLVEFHKPLSSSGLQAFYGAGGYLAFVKIYNPGHQRYDNDINIGAQGIVGLDYKFPNVPINLSLDWKPELNIVSDINFEPAAIGFTARFTFGK